MLFLGLNERFLSVGSKNEYNMICGTPVDVTVISSQHPNKILSNSLSFSMRSDSLMTRYQPCHVVRIEKEASNDDHVSVSFKLDVPTVTKFDGGRGILAFSGELSANGFVEKDYGIYCQPRLQSSILDKVRVLAVGLRGDRLFGLFYIPAVRGIAFETKSGACISSETYKPCDVVGFARYCIDDWFESSMVKEISYGIGV